MRASEVATVKSFHQIVLEHAPTEFDVDGERDMDGGINVCIRQVRSKIIGVDWGEDFETSVETRTEIGLLDDNYTSPPATTTPPHH